MIIYFFAILLFAMIITTVTNPIIGATFLIIGWTVWTIKLIMKIFNL